MKRNSLLMMLVVPLVMLSMIVGITSLGDIRRLGSIGRRTLLYYFATNAGRVLRRDDTHGFGGVMTLDMGTEAAANALMSTLQNKYGFGFMAVSLGYFDTLMSCSGSSTSSEMSDADKASAGISPGLVRLSVGYTGTLEQRWQQLRDALRDVERRKAYAKAG